MSNAVLLECQILTMQFVFFRPFTSILHFILSMLQVYNSDDQSEVHYGTLDHFFSAQFAIVMVENLSVFFAFAGMMKFYHAVRDEIQWCQPFSKFLSIKGVVFMTFWQGLLITIVTYLHPKTFVRSNGASTGDPAEYIQNVLICLEMLLFSLAHFCVFPVEEWEEGYRPQTLAKPGLGFQDFVSDLNFVIDSTRASRATRKKYRESLSNQESKKLDGKQYCLRTDDASLVGNDDALSTSDDRSLIENKLN